MKFCVKVASVSLVVSLLAVFGCYNDHPSDELTYVCDPDNDTCGPTATCVLAGIRYVCSANDGCPDGCGDYGACVNGTCLCFKDCKGMECGLDPLCDISCGACDVGWWCNTGTCEDDCGEAKCGTSLHGLSCGTCQAGWWCDSGVCKNDCPESECGDSPHGVSCGTCQDRWWCNAGTCEDDCAGAECGASPNLGVDCGTCEAGWWCDGGKCKDACVGLECGESLYAGVNCGTCAVGHGCSSGQCIETGEMVLIPSGSFWMGCNGSSESLCMGGSSPYHELMLSGYYIDKNEVTVSAYGACVNAGVCKPPSTVSLDGETCNWTVNGKEDHPVNCVNWNQAVTYCEWAGKRLPTEAEWEKAARGTDGRKYPWGNEDATCDYAVMNYGGYGCGTESTWAACSKSPVGDSPYGLCDMAGNVWEWVSDWYGADYYSSSPSSDPIGAESGSERVIRGGSFYSSADFFDDTLRASLREALDPNVDDRGTLGMRCARDAP